MKILADFQICIRVPLKNDLNYNIGSWKSFLKLCIPKVKNSIFIQKEIAEIVMTGIINKSGKSTKYREKVKWVLKYLFVRT